MIAQSLTVPVDLEQPAAQILVVIFFLVPGLISTWAIERLLGTTPMSVAERILRAVAWSVLLYAIASSWLVRLGRDLVAGELGPWEPIIAFSLLVFAAPVLLALVVLRCVARGASGPRSAG